LHHTFSALGGPRVRGTFVATIALALRFRGRPRSALMLVVATAGMGMINTGLKALFRRQRPSGIPGRKQADGYSFPSGHSSGSLVFFGTVGYLAWHLTRHRVLAACACAVGAVATVLIGYSRVGLRAHHGSDVVGGFALGSAWLAIVLRMFRRPLAQENH
jgi:membrane-associated phospholipid phosphatase